MENNRSYRVYFIIMLLALVVFFILNISLGSVSIPFKDVISSLLGSSSKESWHYIIIDYRLPKSLTAIITGGGLAVAGLLMQTLFRNPLAGPFVLGLSSGASLGVAILILGVSAFGSVLGGFLLNSWSLVIASALGSFLVLLAVMAVALRVKDTMAILIIGLMFGSVTGAVVSVLSYFSDAEQLQQYIFWSFGSLGNMSWNNLIILSICFIIGILTSITCIKPLNMLLLGENYAKSMGLNFKRTTFLIIIATSILAGGITAFAGPIAFIGLAVPHLTRQFITTSNHKILLPAVLLCGSILMLICDTIAQIPFSEYTLPINAITSLLGAPIVIWLLIRKRKLLF
jgi:iron complex transport system permease protein